jgi:hypothetical protein
VSLGWLKIRHTPASYDLWSKYRVALLLGKGAEPCPASKQHRQFGVRLHWGGFEYWGQPLKRGEKPADGEGDQSVYALDLLPENLGKADARRRLPEGDGALTDWSDDALTALGYYLRHTYGMTVVDLLEELVQQRAKVTRLDISADFAATAIEPLVLSMEARYDTYIFPIFRVSISCHPEIFQQQLRTDPCRFKNHR